MTTEAEQLANDLVGGYPEPTWLESEAAAMLRSQAAEIERLTAEAELFTKHVGLKLSRKDALLRECLSVLSASYAENYDEAFELRLEASIKTELGEK
jgi:hypothetical protein